MTKENIVEEENQQPVTEAPIDTRDEQTKALTKHLESVKLPLLDRPAEKDEPLPEVELPATLAEANAALRAAMALPVTTPRDGAIKKNRIRVLTDRLHMLAQGPKPPSITLETQPKATWNPDAKAKRLDELIARYPVFAEVAKKLPLIAFLFLMFTVSAQAQKSGVYPTTLTGGTNTILGASTNFPKGVVTSCAGYSTIGVSVNYSAINTNATNGNLVFKVARSYDGGNSFETTPFYSGTIALPAADAATRGARGEVG